MYKKIIFKEIFFHCPSSCSLLEKFWTDNLFIGLVWFSVFSYRTVVRYDFLCFVAAELYLDVNEITQIDPQRLKHLKSLTRL
jgi:hypothetical protein